MDENQDDDPLKVETSENDLSKLNILDLTKDGDALLESISGISPAPLTMECQRLLERISNCPPSIQMLRKLTMNWVELPEGHQFDPFIHNGYDFVQSMISHFY